MTDAKWFTSEFGDFPISVYANVINLSNVLHAIVSSDFSCSLFCKSKHLFMFNNQTATF